MLVETVRVDWLGGCWRPCGRPFEHLRGISASRGDGAAGMPDPRLDARFGIGACVQRDGMDSGVPFFCHDLQLDAAVSGDDERRLKLKRIKSRAAEVESRPR